MASFIHKGHQLNSLHKLSFGQDLPPSDLPPHPLPLLFPSPSKEYKQRPNWLLSVEEGKSEVEGKNIIKAAREIQVGARLWDKKLSLQCGYLGSQHTGERTLDVLI